MDLDGDHELAAISRDPHYQALVQARGRLGWILSGVMMAIFFGFILLVAFGRTILGQPLPGMTTTIGVPLGMAVILSGIALTSLYVWIANRRFDAELDALRAEHRL
ncbi:DUF485 domain-containing protein [Sphingobium sp. B12D2B]|uniref:DUF485 domain-containing protein n=1 Tax=Sphingobium sp. B12D2B TaxID=2940577 RepID=UPI002224F12F|nr:DUF485 domain-containing protein [Sphingobium sp. B12D2B]MCW2349213.1 uncharacterized membrane protein (DUF485 family) [Sphingobium sp. B12D2B]